MSGHVVIVLSEDQDILGEFRPSRFVGPHYFWHKAQRREMRATEARAEAFAAKHPGSTVEFCITRGNQR